MRYLLLLFLSLWLFTAGAVLAADGPKKGEVDPKSGKIIKYWVAPMDPKYIRDEPGKSPMGMDLVPVYEEEAGEKLPASTIRIDPVTIQNMGVRMAPVRRKPLTQSIRALGTVTYDETRVQVVNLKFDGWIEELFVNSVGESVKKGQPLFRIYSPELVTAQEEYLLAVRQGRSLGNSPYPSIRRNADRLQAAARQRLLYWDLEPALVERLTTSGEPVKTITVYSPAPGVVTKKQVLNGQFIKAGMNQYEIADLSHVWVDVEVYEYELPYVHHGMTVAMDLAYLPGRKIKGEVLFIYPYLDQKTRTVRLRLDFDNRDGLLKPGMYGNVFLESVIDPNALVIPNEAVIDSGLRKVVFVSRGQGKFELRDVKLGIEGNDSTYQVLDGLQEGENIVISAQFMFDSESRLREAIQKMLEVRNGNDDKTGSLSTDDLNIEALKMDSSELDISKLKMD